MLMDCLRLLPAAFRAGWSRTTGTPHTSPMNAANWANGTLANSTCLNETLSRCSISGVDNGAGASVEASSAASSTVSATGGSSSSSSLAGVAAAELMDASASPSSPSAASLLVPVVAMGSSRQRRRTVVGWRFVSSRRRCVVNRRRVRLRGKGGQVRSRCDQRVRRRFCRGRLVVVPGVCGSRRFGLRDGGRLRLGRFAGRGA